MKRLTIVFRIIFIAIFSFGMWASINAQAITSEKTTDAESYFYIFQPHPLSVKIMTYSCFAGGTSLEAVHSISPNYILPNRTFRIYWTKDKRYLAEGNTLTCVKEGGLYSVVIVDLMSGQCAFASIYLKGEKLYFDK